MFTALHALIQEIPLPNLEKPESKGAYYPFHAKLDIPMLSLERYGNIMFFVILYIIWVSITPQLAKTLIHKN